MVDDVISSARINSSPVIDLAAKRVYFNRDLTKQQADAAHQLRCKRRKKKNKIPQAPSTAAIATDPQAMRQASVPDSAAMNSVQSGSIELSVIWAITNIKSSLNNFDELYVSISETQPDIFCISGTLLSSEVTDNLFCPNGYCVVRFDRPTPHKGGSLANMIEPGLKFRFVAVPTDYSHIE
jgi:hypothetical protein